MKGEGIRLIGMPGSGKSTIGKMLAAKLGFSFIDLDSFIEQMEERSYVEILESDDEDALLAKEENCTLGLDLTRTVFAPGGSIVYSGAAMDKLRRETRVIYLDTPLYVIKRNVMNSFADRGVIGLKANGVEKLF